MSVVPPVVPPIAGMNQTTGAIPPQKPNAFPNAATAMPTATAASFGARGVEGNMSSDRNNMAIKAIFALSNNTIKREVSTAAQKAIWKAGMEREDIKKAIADKQQREKMTIKNGKLETFRKKDQSTEMIVIKETMSKGALLTWFGDEYMQEYNQKTYKIEPKAGVAAFYLVDSPADDQEISSAISGIAKPGAFNSGTGAFVAKLTDLCTVLVTLRKVSIPVYIGNERVGEGIISQKNSRNENNHDLTFRDAKLTFIGNMGNVVNSLTKLKTLDANSQPISVPTFVLFNKVKGTVDLTEDKLLNIADIREQFPGQYDTAEQIQTLGAVENITSQSVQKELQDLGDENANSDSYIKKVVKERKKAQAFPYSKYAAQLHQLGVTEEMYNYMIEGAKAKSTGKRVKPSDLKHQASIFIEKINNNVRNNPQ